MGNFPSEIEYSGRLPSGRAAAAPITADVSAPSRALSDLGKAVFQIGAEELEKERRLQYSEGQRKIEESIDSAIESMTGDENSDIKLIETFESSLSAIQYADRRVNSQLELYRNNIMPGVQKELKDRHLELRRKNVHDQFEAESQTLLARGDVTGYHDILRRRLETKDITQAEFDARMATALPDSLLEQARDLMASDRPVDNTRALGILENIQKVKEFELTTEQKEYRNKILRGAKKVQDQQIEDYNQKYWQYLKTGDLLNIEDDLDNPDNPLPVTGDGGKNWWYNLIRTREEKFYQFDPQTRADVLDMIIFRPSEVNRFDIRDRIKQDINGGLTLDQAQEYEEKFNLMLDKNSPLNAPIAKAYFNELKSAQQDRIFSTDQMKNNEYYGQSLDSLTDFFIQYRKKHDRNPSMEDAQAFYSDLVRGYQSVAQPFTEAKIQTTLGELESGGSYNLITGKVIQFPTSVEAVNHALRNLGPNWKTIAPGAVEIINRKWPGANLQMQKTLPAQEAFEIGEQRTDTEGNLRELTDKGWKLVK